MPLARQGRTARVSSGQHVLIVDGPQEIQEVLEAILAPKGLRVNWLPSHVQRVRGETPDAPDLVVIDAAAVPLHRTVQRRDWTGVPQVILSDHDEPVGHETQTERRAVLNKPFHFPELIRAIEQLLPR